MSIRGRRPHSHVRRLMTSPASVRAAVDVEIAETPLADAERLIATFRLRAYSEARLRQRRAAAPEAAAHWGQVANLITRRTSERVAPLDPALGAEHAGPSQGGEQLLEELDRDLPPTRELGNRHRPPVTLVMQLDQRVQRIWRFRGDRDHAAPIIAGMVRPSCVIALTRRCCERGRGALLGALAELRLPMVLHQRAPGARKGTWA